MENNEEKKSRLQHQNKMMDENLPWKAWGSWFSWGSPVGLGLFLISIGVTLYFIHLAGLIG